MPVISIAGPTAAGKTSFSVRLAELLGAEIINADAFQVYRRMTIGTGGPSTDELQRVRHHLVGSLEPWQDYSAGRFAELAGEIVERARAEHRPLLIVGGSGLYLRALFGGLDTGGPSDRSRREGYRRKLRDLGPEALHRQLAERDAEVAARLAPRDAHRVIRALELLDAGEAVPFSEGFRAKDARARPRGVIQLALTLPRDELYGRIGARVDAMLQAGWLDEVRQLVSLAGERGESFASWQASHAIGYGPLVEVMEGRLGSAAAVDLVVRQTRRYAKRQLTWFRGVPGVRWLDADRALRLPEAALLRIVQPSGPAMCSAAGQGAP